MKKIHISLALLVLIALFSSSLSAQQTKEDKKELKEQKKADKKLAKDQKLADGKALLTPFLVPAYTPEMGLTIAVGGLVSFKTKPANQLLNRSNIPLTAGAGVTGAIFAYARPTVYFASNKLRWYSDLWYKDMPDNYWGIGTYNAINVPKSDTTTAYNRTWFMFKNILVYEVYENLFAGLIIDYNYTQGSEPSAGVASDPNYIEYNDKPMNSGVGLVVQYDTRDIPTNAWDGVFVGVEATSYTPSLGGDNNYNLLTIDYRQYKNVGRKGQTMAWQFKTRLADGEVPYGEMGQLGNPFDLRGYTWGRFRDEKLFFLMVEYRHMFMKAGSSTELSKHGMVGWVASGTVAPKPGEAENFLPNFGVGYRLELQPRMNIRVDFGIGRETMGIYMNFNEAF